MKQPILIVLLLCLTRLSVCCGQSYESQVFQASQQGFVSNKGQVADLNGKPRPDVLFTVENKAIYLRKTGISFVQVIDQPEIPSFDRGDDLFRNALERKPVDLTFTRQQVDLNFLDANEKVIIKTEGKLPVYHNYYLSHCADGLIHVPLYQTVEYTNLYEGIDAVFNLTNGVKYDLVVHPGASPKQIVMEWKGADSLYVNENGVLIAKTHGTPLLEKVPLVYQLINRDTVKIQASYQLEKGKEDVYFVRFNLGDYHPDYDLIIDPWITNYGGTGGDYGRHITNDADGNVFLSGQTGSFAAISEAGFQMEHSGEGSDSYLVKFNEDGERLWATYYGGVPTAMLEPTEPGNGVATDTEGNVYLAGATSNASDLASPDGFQTENGGGWTDAYLVKFNADGERLWATYYGGEGEDVGRSVETDILGNVYLCGYTLSETDIAADGHQNVFGGFADAFIVKFNADGDRIWGSYYGGEEGDLFADVTIDKWGNVYAGGLTTSVDFISTSGVFQEVAGGGPDGLLVKFNGDGERQWGTYYGQPWVEQGNAITTDTSGNIYMAGKTAAPTGSASPGAFQMENGGISDAFLAKFDTTGNRLWSTYVGGSLIDYAFGVDVDELSNNVVIAGETYSSDFPVSTCATQTELIGDLNAYVTQFLPDGSLFCSSYLGNEHEAESFLSIHDCWIYVGGTTEGNMSTPGAHQTDFGGGIFDAYLGRVHLASCGLTIMDLTEFEQDQTDVTSCTPCNGSATIDVSGFCLHPASLKTYTWSNGVEEYLTTATSSTIEGICEGDYSVIVTINCDQVDTFYFSIGNTASITANFDAGAAVAGVCPGESVSFENLSTTVFGEIVTNQWAFGDGTITDEENPTHVYTEPGIYPVKLKVENDSGCEDSLIVNIEVFPTYAIFEDTTVCTGSTFIFPNGEEIIVTSPVSRTFSLTTIHGCDSVQTINIAVAPVYAGNEVIYVDEGTSYVFPDGEVRLVERDTSFVSNYLTAFSCDSTVSIELRVIAVPVEKVEVWLKQPNVFTPEKMDGVNDAFFFPASGIEQFRCVIINRWGHEVFRFTSITDQWNGENTSNGKPCPAGVYFYTYTATTNTGESLSGQGSIQLIRNK